MVLTKRIIPCLDIKDGRVVKGTNFVGLRDAGDPVELAARYNEQGADEVVFLDITASKEARGTIVEVIERAADQLFLPLTVGGGIRTTDDIRLILRAGADKVSVNTSAVERPEPHHRGRERVRDPVHRGRDGCAAELRAEPRRYAGLTRRRPQTAGTKS